MIIKIIITLFISILGGVLYRLGGAAKSDNWYRFLQNTKTRDLGVPFLCLCVLWTWNGFSQYHVWAYFLTFFLSFGAMTTYWKKKGEDAKWYNWALVGIGISLGFLPFAVSSSDWLGFLIRTIALTTTTCLWSILIRNAVVEEFGRGFLAVATVVLISIGIKKNK